MYQHRRNPARLAATVAGLAVAAAVSGIGTAHAAPPVDWQDVTANFVTPFDPGAFTDHADHPLIISPYGTTQKIECRSFHGQSNGCRQTDPSGTTHPLTELHLGNRLIRIYNPLA